MMQGLAYRIGSSLYLALTNRANSVTLAASRGPGFAMPRDSGFAPLSHEPSVAELSAAVDVALAPTGRSGEAAVDAVAFAGLGEPLLRLDVLEQTIAHVRSRWPHMRTRLVSNGLVSKEAAPSVALRLRTAGLSAASIALASADPQQYRALMLPSAADPRAETAVPPGLADVCAFVSALVRVGVECECTCVAAHGVDVDAAHALAERLGAKMRTRSYVP